MRLNESRRDALLRVGHARDSCTWWLHSRLDIISACVIFITVIFAVFGRDRLSAGDVALAINYSMRFTDVLGWFVRRVSFTEANIVAVERIEKYLNELEQERAHQLEGDDDLDSDWPKNGTIEFDQLSARYADGMPLVLNSVKGEF